MDDLLTAKFEVNPITLKGKKLTIHLDDLNKALEPYQLRVDSPDDIFIDKDFTEGNVVKILTVYTNADGEWDEKTANWFFKEVKEMEDKFEASSDVVSAADYDRGNKVLTLTLNKKNVELVKAFERGGPFRDGDTSLAHEVDGYLKNKPADVFAMLGMEMPDTQDKLDAVLSDVKSKAIAHLKTTLPPPVKVFFQGKKIDLGRGSSEDALYLQQAFYDKLLDYANQNLNGNNNEAYAREYAVNKSILAIDLVRGMAIKRDLPVFLVNDEIVDEVITKITEHKGPQ